jgi:Mrp family chromosome partitioning ATPase
MTNARGENVAPSAEEEDAGFVDLDPKSYELSTSLRDLKAPEGRATALALRELAEAILTRQIHAGRRGLVVCAPHIGAGATFSALILTMELARAGVSVLLVDGNLRTPGVDALIRPLQGRPGLGDLLEDAELSLEQCLHREVLPNLSILYAGEARPDASELIAGAHCADLLRRLMREFEYVIVDTPPANRAPDACCWAANVGYALIVAREGATHLQDVEALREELVLSRSTVSAAVLIGKQRGKSRRPRSRNPLIPMFRRSRAAGDR